MGTLAQRLLASQLRVFPLSEIPTRWEYRRNYGTPQALRCAKHYRDVIGGYRHVLAAGFACGVSGPSQANTNQMFALCSFCHNLSVLKRLALQLWANADFVRSGFGARLMLWPEKKPAEWEGFASRLATGSFIGRNVDFSWAIRRLRPIQPVPGDTSARTLLLDKRSLTIYALSLNRRNLPARSVVCHSSDNERCGHPVARVGVSSFARDA